MILRHITLALVTIATATAAVAQDGTTAYQYLNLSPSAHAYALGGHNITVIDDDINLVEQNPALLGSEFDKQIGINYMRYVGGTNFMGLRYGSGIREHNAWAAGVQYFGYGTFHGLDEQGNSTGNFTASDIVISATYSHDITENLRGGITLKGVYSNYDAYSAIALATDLGVNYYNPDNDLSASLVAKHLGGQVKKFTDRKASLPWDVQLGISKGISELPLRWSVTAHSLTKWKLPYYEPADKTNPKSELVKRDKFSSNLFRHLVLSLECVPSENLWIGIGYNYKTRTDMSSYQRNLISGFSLGAGLKVKSMGFSLALAQPHTGATTFMFNLTTSLGELLR